MDDADTLHPDYTGQTDKAIILHTNATALSSNLQVFEIKIRLFEYPEDSYIFYNPLTINSY